jgi:hypothetical protein
MSRSAKRKPVSPRNQVKVLVKSRRRCCVCFGLNRDDSIKKGQIAHLDQDPKNSNERNLAFLCFMHHDEYDSRTSQSKNLTMGELTRYKSELHLHFSAKHQITNRESLLNYLADAIQIEQIAETLVRVGREVTNSPDFQIELALTENDICLTDADLALPLVHVLDHLQAWGFLTYSVDGLDDYSSKGFRFRIAWRNPASANALLEAYRAAGAKALQKSS